MEEAGGGFGEGKGVRVVVRELRGRSGLGKRWGSGRRKLRKLPK